MVFLGEWVGGAIGGDDDERWNGLRLFRRRLLKFERRGERTWPSTQQHSLSSPLTFLSDHSIPLFVIVLNNRLLKATTFTSPAHIHKRLVVLANIRDAATMPTPLNKSLAEPLGCEGVECVSYNVRHEWGEREGRAAKMGGRRKTNLCSALNTRLGFGL